ncbi:mucin-12 isoform X2 [Contarinia nasturtii]|uniref:mucin-12 isoform X2 n=1 Tax=Contarinia nasturtii TaxID=265458 RepID=UPI0012D40671|nr:mucin-12 isoform X2 [Contarinia nasturtii]
MNSPDTGGGTNTTSATSNSGSGEKTNPIIKQNAFPMDLAPKIALVKPTDGKGATVQTQFRTITPQPMRVVVSTGTASAQIIQTQIMPQAMLKQVDALGRTQITALPSRTMAQTSITVTRPLTPNTFMPRGVTTNIGSRGAIRAQTPPSVANLSTNFVRGTIPPRTPSPAGTVIPTATTWMTGSQPVQLIRANIGQAPRTKFTAVSSANTGITTISANIVSSQSGTGTNTIQNVSQQQSNQNVSSATASGQSQTYVATLATVLPPRHQTATLVYSNPQQLGTNVTGPRLAVASPIATQRQVRPIQISNARLPTAGLSRVSTAPGSISIRGPVLTPSSVLTTLPSGTNTTASNLTVANLPAARIIQVQQPNSGGQVLSTGRITAMTLHPLVVNASNVSTANTVRGVSASTAKPSLTITHVGKNPQNSVQLATASLSQGATITGSVPSSTSVVQHQSQSSQHSGAGSSAPIGIVPASQIAQIVNLNQSGINVGHGHQIQIIGSQGTQQTSTVVPLTITSRAAHTSLSGTSVTTLPASVATNLSQIVRGNVNIVTTANTNSNTTTVLPIAKVLPQQQGMSNVDPPPIVSVGTSQNVVNVVNANAINNRAQSSSISSTAVLQSITTNTSAITTNVSSSNTAITASYAPQAGSFAVVPSSNRNIVNSSSSGLVSSTVVQQSGSQPIPVRFNPQLIVDGNKESTSYDGLLQKQLGGHQQISYISMPSNQSLANQQKTAHIIPVSGTKSNAVAVAVSSSPRATTIVSTAPRKRDHDFRAEVVQQIQANQRISSPVSPGSSDGSTTVSATSSPGIDQQEELNALYQQHQNQLQHNIGQPLQQQQQQQASQQLPQTAHSINISNGSDDLTPRKRPRKQQFSEYPQAAKKFQPELDVHIQPEQQPIAGSTLNEQGVNINYQNAQANTSAAANLTNRNAVKPSNENSPPKYVDFYIKRPKACNLLDSYKHSWKSTHNHFQRYSDVKPREERKPTVVDLANQTHVLQKVNGWKIYHLTSQMEDLTELESQVYDKLSSMLQCMEAHEQNTDVDRVNELIKGNMQRSKIVSDSINEARVQILKVFDHKSHVSDIIHRCASKRNLKKREKS